VLPLLNHGPDVACVGALIHLLADSLSRTEGSGGSSELTCSKQTAEVREAG